MFCYLLLDFYVKFSLRDKRFLEIIAVEITRVDCNKLSILDEAKIRIPLQPESQGRQLKTSKIRQRPLTH